MLAMAKHCPQSQPEIQILSRARLPLSFVLQKSDQSRLWVGGAQVDAVFL